MCVQMSLNHDTGLMSAGSGNRFLTVTVTLSVSEPFTVSVADTLWLPAVFSVTKKL